MLKGPAGLPGLRLADARDVPVIVVSFNRSTCLARQIAWLRAAGQRRIVVVDNASTWPPLRDLLDRVERQGVQVLRMTANHGHRVLWTQELLPRLGIESEFVLTDPDVLPDAACPRDLIGHLHRVLAREPEVHRVGPGLRMDRVPDAYPHKAAALRWERQFWTRPAAPGLFAAPIDTTMALYRPGAPQGFDDLTLRTDFPYLANHVGFGEQESEEARHYAAAVRRDSSLWASPTLTPEVQAALPELSPERRLLQVTRGGGPAWHGWVRVRPWRLGGAEAGAAQGIFAAEVPGARLWAALRRAIAPEGLLVLRVQRAAVERLRGAGSRQSASRCSASRWSASRWSGSGGPWSGQPVPAQWRVTRLLWLTREAVLHLRPAPDGTAPFAEAVEDCVPGDLDLATDFARPCAGT